VWKKAITRTGGSANYGSCARKARKILLSLGRTSWWYLMVWIGNGLGVLLLFRSISETPTAESVQLPRLPMICLKGVLLLRGLLRKKCYPAYLPKTLETARTMTISFQKCAAFADIDAQ
jgi:hypothetical protein